MDTNNTNTELDEKEVSTHLDSDTQDTSEVTSEDKVLAAPKDSIDEKKFKWYIISSSSGKEKKTGELIKQRVKANNYEDKITEVVVPIQEKVVIKRGKKQTVEERIFPGYILVKMEPTEEGFYLIKNTEGVTGFVGSTAKAKLPTPLSNKEAEVILAFTQVKQNPTFETKLQITEAVKVVEGPFKDFIGTVQEINESKGQVTVLLSIFGQDTPVQLDFLQVSKIS